MTDAKDRELRKRSPKGAKVFEKVLKEGRKEHPWLPAWDSNLQPLKEMEDDRDAQGVYELLYLRYQHAEFDKLCQRIMKEEKCCFDAWGPLHLPAYLTFFNGLPQRDQDGFSQYLALRRRKTIHIEAGYWHKSLTYPEFQNLLLSTHDARQRFRFLACVAEHPDEFLANSKGRTHGQFTKLNYKEAKDLYKQEKKRYAETFALKESFYFSTMESPLKWKGKKADLIAIADALNEAGLLDTTDKEIVYHFDFPSKFESQNPVKRYSGTRSEMKKHTDNPNAEAIKKFIALLEKSLP